MTWTLFLYRLPAKGALTHHPPKAGGGMVCGHRAPSGGNGDGAALPPFPPLPVHTADANGGLCIGRRYVDALGAWGPSATNKLRRVYTGALLATTIRAQKELTSFGFVVYLLMSVRQIAFFKG